MTELLPGTDTPSDAELISRVRGGDLAAYGELFERHVEAARRLARQLVRGIDSDDLVSDAFAKVMTVLQGGGGPDVAFRAYLLTAVRRLHVDRIRRQSRLTHSEDMAEFDPGVPFHDTVVAGFESGAAAKAFASLPERWQLVLWHLEVEGHKPADIAPLLGMSANSVSALAYRAREGLRQAFLTAHLADTSQTECRWVTEHLGAYVREGLAKRDSAKVKAHLDECRECTAMYLELSEVNSNLKAIIAPLLLGGAAAGYLASATSGAAAGGGALLLLDRAKDAVVANLATVAAGAAAAGIAAVAVVAVAVGGGGDAPPAADAPPSPAVTRSTPEQPTPPGAEPSPKRGSPEPTPVPVVPAAEPVDSAPIRHSADISLASVSVSGDALVLDVDGLPAARVPIHVDLRSESGETTFRARDGDCTVTESNKRRAVCDAGSGSARAALLLLAPQHLHAVIPLAYPDSLGADELSVTISIPGYHDPSEADNTRRVSFHPETEEGSEPTPTPVPEPTPTPTPEPDPEADLHLAVTRLDDTRVQAHVTGLPTGTLDLDFDLTTTAGVQVVSSPDGSDATGSFQGDFTFDYPAELAPIDVTVAVSAAGVEESEPADNSSTVRLREVPQTVLALDIVRLEVQSILNAGQFQAIVSWPAAAIDPAQVRFHDIVTDPSTAFHHGPPAGCTAEGQDFVCTVDDSDGDNSWVADRFDLDLSALIALEQPLPVTVSMQVSVEPDNGTSAASASQCVAWPLNLC